MKRIVVYSMAFIFSLSSLTRQGGGHPFTYHGKRENVVKSRNFDLGDGDTGIVNSINGRKSPSRSVRAMGTKGSSKK